MLLICKRQVSEGAVSVSTNWDDPNVAVDQHGAAGAPPQQDEQAASQPQARTCNQLQHTCLALNVVVDISAR